ncbi:terminase small subunit [Gordonia phage Ecliptus]|nr:terminase small subunit [Gordonia phage Ecliptus]
MAEYDSLSAAMAAGDELAEAEIRYDLLAEAFLQKPQLRSQLNTQLERAKAEIVRLRALAKKPDASKEKVNAGKVVAFDADRFRKSG